MCLIETDSAVLATAAEAAANEMAESLAAEAEERNAKHAYEY